jgi:tetratricopeptide (TPR) repeat protein
MILHESLQSDDELALDQAIAEFLRAESSGRAGDRQQWLDRYPACAAGLMEFFDDRERVNQMAMPLKAEGLSDSSHKATSAYDTVSFTVTPPNFAAPRYRPMQFHARGGMGEVWLAHDERIGRKVAVKKLRTGRDPRQARFMIEAQVTGQLEHPCVVPLHDLGVDDAGEPYYVMKFVHGRSLGEAIVDYHAHKDCSDWPGELEFLRLLEAFVGVCNAVAYAHSKGVLHRDIKPANVMLGPYGETLVLDWGLAKVISQPDQPGEAPVEISNSDSSMSHDAGIVGTPVYMSPEEAQGNAEAIDRASDVYLLGATLYEILTGRPPRQGSSKWELLEQARNSRPVSPRQVDARIPRALEAICLKAMAFRKQDRFATATELAEDVERFLAGEPTAAYPEPLPARILRWVRRHRRGIGRGLVIVGALVLSGFALHGYRQAQRLAGREQARVRLNDFYRLADEAQFFAANTDAASEEVPYYDGARAKADGEAALAIAAPWGAQAEQLPLVDQRADFLQVGYNLHLLLAQLNLQASRNAGSAREALALLDAATALGQPSRGYYQLRSRCLTLLNRPEAAHNDSQRSAAPETRVSAEDHFLEGESLRWEDVAGNAHSIDDSSAEHRKRLARAIEAYQSALRLDPRHYWAQYQLGRCLLALGRPREAVEALAACVAMRPDSPWAYTTRGLARALSGDPGEATADLNRALKLDPAFQPARLNRGVVHWLLDHPDAAIADFDAVLAAPAGTRLIEAAYYRGQLLLKKDRAHEALADVSMVIDARGDFRPAYWLRAQIRFHLGSYDDGQADLARFLALGRHPSDGKPGLDPRVDLGKALRRLALELGGEAKIQAFDRAAKTLEAAIAAGPPSAEAFQQLGAALHSLGKLQEAIAAYSRGLVLDADRVPLRNLRGWAYAATQQFELARADFAEALRLEPDNPESHTGLGFAMAEGEAADDAQTQALAATLSGADNYLVLHHVACIYGRLSQSARTNKVEYEDMALAALKRAVALSRQNPAGPDEIALMRQETAFPDSLRARPEFERLLSGNALSDR